MRWGGLITIDYVAAGRGKSLSVSPVTPTGQSAEPDLIKVAVKHRRDVQQVGSYDFTESQNRPMESIVEHVISRFGP